MSLRTSAHTGAAIRFPAEIPGKTVVHRANSQLLRICREELLFVLCCCKENGLPRRFAPRNDMLKTGRCQRLQERITGANSQLFRIRREKLLSVMSYRKEYGLPRRFAPRNDMLKTGRCQRLQERITGANSQLLRIRREKLLSVMSYRKEYGLPRRGAAAPLLAMTCRRWAGVRGCKDAMTCRNLPGVCVCKNVLPWQIRSAFRICPKYCFSFCPTARRSGLPRRFAPRNDMQKVGRCARVQGRNDMQKLAGCLRVQRRNAVQNLAGYLHLPGGTAGAVPPRDLSPCRLGHPG